MIIVKIILVTAAILLAIPTLLLGLLMFVSFDKSNWED